MSTPGIQPDTTLPKTVRVQRFNALVTVMPVFDIIRQHNTLGTVTITVEGDRGLKIVNTDNLFRENYTQVVITLECAAGNYVNKVIWTDDEEMYLHAGVAWVNGDRVTLQINVYND